MQSELENQIDREPCKIVVRTIPGWGGGGGGFSFYAHMYGYNASVNSKHPHPPPGLTPGD